MIGASPSTLPAPSRLAAKTISFTQPAVAGWVKEQVMAALLVIVPVFIQAPWVRQAPFGAALFTVVLLSAGLVAANSANRNLQRSGELLVGFSGSWLAGALFWGWASQHPICHLPVEAFALPLALTGLGSRWRLACGFYLGSLLGTATTDAAIAACHLMQFWPDVLLGDPQQAEVLLRLAAQRLLQPGSILILCGFALALGLLSRWLWHRGEAARIAATALGTTLVVDGLFVVAALAAPHLSGLI